MVSYMEKQPMKIKLGEIPEGKTIDDYPEDTMFILDDDDPMEKDSFWEEEE